MRSSNFEKGIVRTPATLGDRQNHNPRGVFIDTEPSGGNKNSKVRGSLAIPKMDFPIFKRKTPGNGFERGKNIFSSLT